MTLPRAALAVSLSLTACAGQPGPASQPDGSLLLRDITLIDGTGTLPREHVSVLVRSGVIEEIGDTLEVRGAQVVEGRGRFLIPGLWDVHVHVTYGDETMLGVLVANGVTSVRDMGGELDVLEAWRARIEKGELVGPRIFRAGPTVDGPKPPGTRHRLTITNPEEARAAVTRLRELGVDLIKVHNAVPRDTYFALAAEARKQGIPFAGHVPMTVEPAEAAEAGQHSVEHIATLIEGTYAAGMLGTIAPGKAADLVLLDGDPLADVKNVGRISAVVLRGKLLEREDLDRLLEAAASTQ